MARKITSLVFLIFFILFNCAQATITTKGHRFIVDEGDSVELPCSIRNIGMFIIPGNRIGSSY